MRIILLSIFPILIGCGGRTSVVEYRDICTSDSPPIMLPKEVVCNHSPDETIFVKGNKVTYICNRTEVTSE